MSLTGAVLGILMAFYLVEVIVKMLPEGCGARYMSVLEWQRTFA